MKTLIAISDPDLKHLVFGEEAMSRLKAVSEVDVVSEGIPFCNADLTDVIGDYDAVLTSWGSPKITAEVARHARKLKFVGHAAGTVALIVDRELIEQGIVVVNANEPLARSTAEGAVAIMMAGSWRLFDYARRLKAGEWPEQTKQFIPGLSGQPIGIVGFGEIAREVIRLLQPFELEIAVCSNHMTAAQAAKLGVRLMNLEELLRGCGIISLHNTLTPATRGMIGERELRWIPEGALFLNTARGALVEERALVRFLSEGKHFAVLDVFETEPLFTGHPLLSMDHVVCLPHIAGTGGRARKQLGLAVVKELERWLQGESIDRRITVERFDRLTRE